MNIAQNAREIVPEDAAASWGRVWGESYARSRQEYLERYGGYIARERWWKAIAFASTVIAGLSLFHSISVGLQSQVVPYVVQIDKLGAVAAVGPAERLERPDRKVITAQLDRWITAARTVFVDAAAQRTYINEAYAMIDRNGDAYAVLNEHMRANNPFQRAAEETVAVEVQSVLPLAGNTWRLEWRESTRDRGAQLKSTFQYQATVTIGFSQPRDEATIRANPIGLYINAFHWARRL
jgi:type IV secretion system protein TrbF